MSQSTKPSTTNVDSITFDKIIEDTIFTFRYVYSKWLTILIISFTGAVVGLAFSVIKPTTYTATCSFVLETGDKTDVLGQYASMASLAGVSFSGGGGLFQGDNILELYNSRSMIEKTLLSTGTFNGKNELLIDRYIDSYHLRKKWARENMSTINFNGDPLLFSRVQDSIVSDLTKLFKLKYLSVTKPDKKLSIIIVGVKSYDELFAKAFANKIVENVNTFFVQTKTKKTSENIKILKHQADSVRRVLNSAISGVASALDAAPNASPEMLSLRVPSQKKQIDVQASSAVYSEIMKNLEISRISLNKETPLIQLIDLPVLPLDNNRILKLIGTGAGFGIFALLGILLFTLRSFSRKVVLSEV